MSMYNFDMFGINSDRSVSISTLLGVARDDTMIIIYIFSLFLTFQYVSNFSAIRGFLISWVFPVIFILSDLYYPIPTSYVEVGSF